MSRSRPEPQLWQARKPVTLGDITLMPGAVVPGAQHWPRLESWIRSGHLVPADAVEAYQMNDPLPEQTDNRDRPEDGAQDVSQDPDVTYGDDEEDS